MAAARRHPDVLKKRTSAFSTVRLILIRASMSSDESSQTLLTACRPSQHRLAARRPSQHRSQHVDSHGTGSQHRRVVEARRRCSRRAMQHPSQHRLVVEACRRRGRRASQHRRVVEATGRCRSSSGLATSTRSNAACRSSSGGLTASPPIVPTLTASQQAAHSSAVRRTNSGDLVAAAHNITRRPRSSGHLLEAPQPQQHRRSAAAHSDALVRRRERIESRWLMEWEK